MKGESWLVVTKVPGSFWQVNCAEHSVEKAREQAEAFQRGGYLARIVRDVPYKPLIENSFHAAGVQ